MISVQDTLRWSLFLLTSFQFQAMVYILLIHAFLILFWHAVDIVTTLATCICYLCDQHVCLQYQDLKSSSQCQLFFEKLTMFKII